MKIKVYGRKQRRSHKGAHNIVTQLVLLPTIPDPARIDKVQNPRVPSGSVHQWYGKSGYRGNKPFGGLWTSSFTPADLNGYRSDWEWGLAKNEFIKKSRPEGGADCMGWKLSIRPEAKVLIIDTMRQAKDFTAEYLICNFKLPSIFQSGTKCLTTTLITDWVRALRDYDGIQLTARACNEITYQKIHTNQQTAFDTWNCESTFWKRWCFIDFHPATDCVAPMKGFVHYNLQLGHLNRCFEVPREGVELLRPLVAKGGFIPKVPGFRFTIEHHTGGSTFTFYAEDEPLLACCLAWDSPNEPEMWQRTQELYHTRGDLALRSQHLGALPEKPKTLPWLSVVLFKSVFMLSPEQFSLLHDVQRCLAFAILQVCRNQQASSLPAVQSGEAITLSPLPPTKFDINQH